MSSILAFVQVGRSFLVGNKWFDMEVDIALGLLRKERVAVKPSDTASTTRDVVAAISCSSSSVSTGCCEFDCC